MYMSGRRVIRVRQFLFFVSSHISLHRIQISRFHGYNETSTKVNRVMMVSNTTGATSGARTAYTSGEFELTPGL